MAKNVFLFYGEDLDSRDAKLAQWFAKFNAQGDALFDRQDIEGSDAKWDDIQAALYRTPLLASKRLLVLKNVLNTAKKPVQDELRDSLAAIPNDLIMVLVEEGDISAKNELLQAIKHNYTVYHFPAPTARSAIQQIAVAQSELELTIDSGAKQLLLQAASMNPQGFAREFEKITLLPQKTHLTAELVEELMPSTHESKVFDLIDAIFTNNSDKAAKLMMQEYELGTAPLQLLALLMSQTRKLIALKDGAEKQVREETTSRLMDIKPFSLNKMRGVVQKTSLEAFINYYTRLTLADFALKTGSPELSVLLSLVTLE